MRTKITDGLLDQLGLTPYKDGAGDFGTRSVRGPVYLDKPWRTLYTIYVFDEQQEDPRDVNSPIVPQHYCNQDFEKIEYLDELLDHFKKTTGLNLAFPDFLKRDLSSELKEIGLTSEQVINVLKWTEKLPIHIFDVSNTKVSINQGVITVEVNDKTLKP